MVSDMSATDVHPMREADQTSHNPQQAENSLT
jgi:hypothetical protein